MDSKSGLLKKSRLYLVIDTGFCRNILNTASCALRSGADIIQLRSYDLSDRQFLELAFKLKKICNKFSKLFVINNRADIAKLVSADGLHIGQNDLPISKARLLIGNDKIIGKSCSSFDQAKSAVEEGANYLGFGTVFKTTLKPKYKIVSLDEISKVQDTFIKLPVFAIGGINLSNIKLLRSSGINRVAVCRQICSSKDPAAVTKALKSRLGEKI